MLKHSCDNRRAYTGFCIQVLIVHIPQDYTTEYDKSPLANLLEGWIKWLKQKMSRNGKFRKLFNGLFSFQIFGFSNTSSWLDLGPLYLPSYAPVVISTYCYEIVDLIIGVMENCRLYNICIIQFFKKYCWFGSTRQIDVIRLKFLNICLDTLYTRCVRRFTIALVRLLIRLFGKWTICVLQYFWIILCNTIINQKFRMLMGWTRLIDFFF